MIWLAATIGVLGIAAMGCAHRSGHSPEGASTDGPFAYDIPGLWSNGGALLQSLLRRLDASPDQERAIVAEVERLGERARAAGAGLDEARSDLAAAVRGRAVDDAALGAVIGRVDMAVGEVRAAAIDALRGVHGVLDDRQRTELAAVVEQRDRWWRRMRQG